MDILSYSHIHISNSCDYLLTLSYRKEKRVFMNVMQYVIPNGCCITCHYHKWILIWLSSFIVSLRNKSVPLETINVMHLFYLFLFFSLSLSLSLSRLCAFIKRRASCCKSRTDRWSSVVNISYTPRIAVTLLLQFLIMITINKRKCCSRNEKKNISIHSIIKIRYNNILSQIAISCFTF